MNIYILCIGEVAKTVRTNLANCPPLTEQGKAETELILKSIKLMKLNFDVIISSPGTAASQTVQIIENNYGSDVPKILVWDELLPEGDRNRLYEKMRTFNVESSVLIIGTRAYLLELINDIISNNSRNKTDVFLKNNGFAKLKIKSLQKFKGELRWLLNPRILKLFSNLVKNEQMQPKEIQVPQRYEITL
jgi:phosphohistidine phosphatase SixA